MSGAQLCMNVENVKNVIASLTSTLALGLFLIVTRCPPPPSRCTDDALSRLTRRLMPVENPPRAEESSAPDAIKRPARRAHRRRPLLRHGTDISAFTPFVGRTLRERGADKSRRSVLGHCFSTTEPRRAIRRSRCGTRIPSGRLLFPSFISRRDLSSLSFESLFIE